MLVGWSSIVGRRLARQHLTQRASGAEDAARGMVGVHAQLRTAAELSLSARVHGLTTDDIAVSLRAGGSLVKTYGPRGTIHLLARSDLPLWCAALGATPPTSNLPEGIRLEPEQADAVVTAIGNALRGTELDGDELHEAVAGALPEWASELTMPAFGGHWPRWRQALGLAASKGVLVFGEGRGSRVTYLNPEVTPAAEADAALDWLLAQYLYSYGPATPAQFGRWIAAKPAWSRTLFDRNAERLETVETDDGDAQVIAGDVRFDDPPAAGIRLLGHFDSYVVGSWPRERLFPGTAFTRALARGQAGNHPVLLQDGVVTGIWTSKRAGGRLAITVEPFATPTPALRLGIDAEAERVGHFLGLAATLTFDDVTTRAHL